MRLSNEAELNSPSLVLHLERVEENMRRMVEIAGGPRRLRPHVKTHKLAPLIAKQITLGIHKFKCATIAEAEMVAAAGGTEVLLAAQPVGPHIARFIQLIKKFPRTYFTTLVDDLNTVHEIDNLPPAELAKRLQMWASEVTDSLKIIEGTATEDDSDGQ